MTYREIGISIRSAYSQGWPDDASACIPHGNAEAVP